MFGLGQFGSIYLSKALLSFTLQECISKPTITKYPIGTVSLLTNSTKRDVQLSVLAQ